MTPAAWKKTGIANGTEKSKRGVNSKSPLSKIIPEIKMTNVKSNKITAIRLAIMAELDDPGLHNLIDYETLQIHGADVADDIESKKQYFRGLQHGGRVKILNALEENTKVAVPFKIIKDGAETVKFHIYRFNENGLLVEAWMYN